MKKYLSLVLALALVLTTIALPMSAFAAGTASVNVTYTVTKDGEAVGTVYAGDVVTITAYATATENVTLSSWAVEYVKSANLTESGEASGLVNNNYVRSASDSELALTADVAAELFSVDYVVSDGSNVAGTFTTTTDGIFTNFMEAGQYDLYNAATDVNQAFSANSAVGQIKAHDGESFGNIPANTTYHDAGGVVVKVVATGNLASAELYKDGAKVEAATKDALTAEAGYAVTESGAYELKYTPLYGTEATESFSLVAVDVDTTLALDGTALNTTEGYKAGATFDVPVKISGLESSEVEAVMVSFEVVAAEGVELTAVADTVDDVDSKFETVEGKTVVSFGTDDGTKGIAADGTLVTLTFTVAQDAAIGTKDITISNAQLVLASNQINPENGEMSIETATVSVTVVPETFFTLGDAPEDWTNQDYDQAVNDIPESEAITVKYLSSETEVETANAQTVFDATQTVVENGVINIADENYYYVVAKVGTVYSAVATVTNKYDGTVPALDVSSLNMEAWVSSKDADQTVTFAGGSDTRSGFAGYEYATTEADEYASAASYTVSAGTSATELWLKAVDNAGNKSEAAKVTLMYDGDAPQAAIEVANELNQNSGKDLTITASDATSDIKSAELYHSATDVDTIEGLAKKDDITLEEGSATYSAKEEGYYFVKVVDSADNETVVKSELVELTKVTVAALNAKSCADGTEFKLVNANGLAGYGATTNGTFASIKVKVAAVEGAESVITFTEGGEAYEVTADEEGYYLITEAGDYVASVVTTKSEYNFAETTYTFSIAADQNGMKSVDNDAYYTIFDFDNIRRVVGNEEAGVLQDAQDGFTGGVFCGDVTGDGLLKAEDHAAIIEAFRDFERPGSYTFNIMTKMEATPAE